MDIYATICDAPTHKVGLLVRGTKAYRLVGENANTFTGDVVVDGKGQYFALAKRDGVTAVSGNIYVKNGAWVGVDTSSQIADSSIVTLSGKGSIFGLLNTGRSLTEKFHRLSISRYDDGILGFYHQGDSFQKSLFLDELEVGTGASLMVEGWQDGRDHLFVKKTSRSLKEALKNTRFEGKSEKAGVRDYNADYWEIGVGDGFRPLPESAVYGAAFSLSALGFVAWRRRVRRSLATP